MRLEIPQRRPGGFTACVTADHAAALLPAALALDLVGGRAPRVILLENVPGFLTSDAGRGFGRVTSRLNDLGYHCQCICVDAAAFVPQSRPRVFVLAKKGQPFEPPEPPARREDLRLFDIASRRRPWWCGDQKEIS